jgi:CheY-like chemotaxis protein
MTPCVLVVDDIAVNIVLASTVLKLAGYQVLAAGNAHQALQIVANTVPDLILMDLSLPDIDGLTLTRRLKADPRFLSVPIVAFSALTSSEDEKKARDAGCAGYITKPIKTREFPAQVAAFLELATRAGAA